MQTRDLPARDPYYLRERAGSFLNTKNQLNIKAYVELSTMHHRFAIGRVGWRVMLKEHRGV